ncbi:MAG: aminoglycoside phosphotransferase family protein [Puniceicoccales bacterium]|nr:aminoglycoside phosphotransferase family protein [Puniceicoccales bacterium]
MQFDIRAIAGNFAILGDFVSATPHGDGHINDTYATTFNQGGTPVRYIVQRVNHAIFRDATALMSNVARVCRHAGGRLRADNQPDASRRALTLVPTRDGSDWVKDAAGNHWRCFLFIEGAASFNVAATPSLAFHAAHTFGEFTRLLSDLPGERLAETIPDFHHTRKRYEAFLSALETDAAGRSASVANEVRFLKDREKDCSVIVDAIKRGEIPERITHNDTKLNNILMDVQSGRGLCVVDLDTVMPGSALYDFGDMVRSGATSALEDETDLDAVTCRADHFKALASGFITALKDTLNDREKELLAFSGKLMTLEVGMRFLTDYLCGDTYFKIAHPAHNLERCRNQFALVSSIEKQLSAFEKIVARA